jgi:indolepyruvate ferredoxin oxidoreductase beta subunit
MLGAIAGSGLLPFAREAFERVICGGRDIDESEKLNPIAAASLQGFASAFFTVNMPQAHASMVASLMSTSEDEPVATATRHPLPADVQAAFPPPVHGMLALGHARLVDYQDAEYAAQYVERLQQVLLAERAVDPAGAGDYAITREMARWLALWMAFDDIVRVAELKSRASRAERVRREVKADEDDIVKVFDHFKPGIPEFAALLPPSLADRVVAWDRRRQSRGKAPWALPLKVGSHAVLGMVSLRLLASLRGWRKRGSRFEEEQRLIGRWLDAVLSGTRRDWQLGHEIALCGRLIKGYGSTNERGKRNLLHVIDHLAVAPLGDGSAKTRASAIAAAREAALADEAGTALDAALVRHGAPPRPVVAQPIRWMKRSPAANTSGASSASAGPSVSAESGTAATPAIRATSAH